MLNKIFSTVLIIAISSAGYAQKKRDRDFELTILGDNDLSGKTAAKLNEAFRNTYPFFAMADGYRTKRKVTLTFTSSATPTINAKEGEIVVNQDWVKSESESKIETELKDALAKNWSSYTVDKRKGYKLTFVSKDPNLDPKVRQNLIDTYFEVYPTLVKTFNNQSTKDVLFVVDTAYKAVAEASGNRILFSAGYMKAHPTDIDVVTHETMHIVQGYGYGSGPVWLTEGIADYVRYKYGVDNIGSKWSLPDYNPKQNYTNSYRITARFFAWLEKNVKPGLIATLDGQLRTHTYTEKSWADLTGKNLDQLWSDYTKNPQIELTYSGK